jgi:hypothetical protein
MVAGTSIGLGYVITAPFILANARPEAIFHVIFHSFEVISPMVTRASSVSGASCGVLSRGNDMVSHIIDLARCKHPLITFNWLAPPYGTIYGKEQRPSGL